MAGYFLVTQCDFALPVKVRRFSFFLLLVQNIKYFTGLEFATGSTWP